MATFSAIPDAVLALCLPPDGYLTYDGSVPSSDFFLDLNDFFELIPVPAVCQIQVAASCLTGQARKFYDQWLLQHQSQAVSFEQFKQDFVEVFPTGIDIAAIQAELRSRKQQLGQRSVIFALETVRLFYRINPTCCDNEILACLYNQLLPQVTRFVKSHNPTSLQSCLALLRLSDDKGVFNDSCENNLYASRKKVSSDETVIRSNEIAQVDLSVIPEPETPLSLERLNVIQPPEEKARVVDSDDTVIRLNEITQAELSVTPETETPLSSESLEIILPPEKTTHKPFVVSLAETDLSLNEIAQEDVPINPATESPLTLESRAMILPPEGKAPVVYDVTKMFEININEASTSPLSSDKMRYQQFIPTDKISTKDKCYPISHVSTGTETINTRRKCSRRTVVRKVWCKDHKHRQIKYIWLAIEIHRSSTDFPLIWWNPLYRVCLRNSNPKKSTGGYVYTFMFILLYGSTLNFQ